MRLILIALSAAAAACGRAPAAEPRPEPEPPARASVESAGRHRPTVLTDNDRIRICIVHDGQVREVLARYDTRTGDTATTEGRSSREAYPQKSTEYAGSASWMILNEPIPFRGQRYVKYGPERVYGVREVERVGDYQGVPLFTEAGTGDRLPALLLVPVRQGCEFQTYQNSFEGNAVRG